MIYVSSSCICDNRIGNIVNSLGANDIKSIELSGGTSFYNSIEDDLQLYKRKYDLEYVCHAYFPPAHEDIVVNLASCNESIYKNSIQHYMSCIEMLSRIGCHILSIHAGFLVELTPDTIGKSISNLPVYDEESAYMHFCYAYEKIESECNKRGIKLYLENNVVTQEDLHDYSGKNMLMMTDYESFLRMKKYISFDLLLDLAHLYVSSTALNLDFYNQCRQFQEHVKWIHMSDNDGIHDQHKPLVEGSVIMKTYNDLFRHSGCDVTLETKGSIKSIIDCIELLQ